MMFSRFALYTTLVLVGSAAAQQQTATTHKPHVKRVKQVAARVPAPAYAPPAAPAPPPTPETSPAIPPQVSYAGGMLTIIAENSTLADILNAVKTRTGATIDAPGGLNERVATRLGPAPPRQVLADLLKGSHYDYVLLGSDSDPLAVRSVILTRNSAAPGVSGPATASGAAPQQGGGVNDMLRRMRNNPAPNRETAEEPSPEAEAEQPEETPPAAQVNAPQVPPPHAQGQGGQPGNPQVVQPMPPDMNQSSINPAANGQPDQRVRTPEELLQELQRMQQQQQQQQQQEQQQQ